MATNSPIPLKRLEQIASDACNSALAGVETYEHPKTAQWNETIIQKMLKAVMSEATPSGTTNPTYKFAINSTIVQHVVPTSQLSKATGTSTPAPAEEKAPTKKGPAGRRGMHSATGGFWNEKTDGMWSYKFDGEDKGLDVVIMLIWIAV
ncbi:putative dynein light chain protein [Cercophora newfieldiana]|uniref:Dynein light chain protein n=1 Tax=Cercophora newfieldiana TaxID=92897 RepID=A0AA39Y333_9PEZI|nr:putative dynein light chain protein [Cercophora newfieldiana]